MPFTPLVCLYLIYDVSAYGSIDAFMKLNLVILSTAFAFIPLETYFSLSNYSVRKTSKCGLLPSSIFHLWNFDSSGIGVVVKFEAGICYDSQVPFHVHDKFIFYFLLLMASLLKSSFTFPPLPFPSTPPSFFPPFSDRVYSSAWAGLESPRTVGTAGCTSHRARHALLIVIVVVLRGGILRGGLARRTLPSWMDYCNSVAE